MITGLLFVLVAGMMMMTMTTTHAFSPAAPQPRVVASFSAGKTKPRSILMMSSEEGDSDQKKQPTVSADGTFYDDEVRTRIVLTKKTDSFRSGSFSPKSTIDGPYTHTQTHSQTYSFAETLFLFPLHSTFPLRNNYSTRSNEFVCLYTPTNLKLE